MDFVRPNSESEAEQWSLDHAWEPTTLHGRPLNITTINPSFLQNIPEEKSIISHFQPAPLQIPSQFDQIPPQVLGVALPYQLDTRLWMKVAPTTAHVSENELHLDVYPASSPYSSGQTTLTPVAPNVLSLGIPTTNPQPQLDFLRNQPQFEFQGVTKGLETTRRNAQSWESVKPTIARLYSENSLSKVMEIMENEFGFHASARMYKSRISQWGLNKNFRRQDAISILHRQRQRAAIGKGTILSRNGKEVDIKRYLKRAKITEYDLMDLSEKGEVPRGVEFRTPSPSNDSTASPSILQLRNDLLVGFKEALTFWKNIDVESSWTAACYHSISQAMTQLAISYNYLIDGRTQDFGAMLRLAFAEITDTFDPKSPACMLSLVLGFHRFPHAGMSDVIWRYLTCLTRERYSECHPAHRIFCSIYRLLQRHGFAVYQDFWTECLPTIMDIMIGEYDIMDPNVVHSALELAKVFGHFKNFQLEKVLDGLKEAERAAKASNNSVERLIVRSYIIEILALVEDGTTKTSRFSFLEESLHHIEVVETDDPTDPRIPSLKTECLASLGILHHKFCGDSPARFNPRHKLARDFMERAICVEIADCWDADPTNVLWKMDRLLEWHLEAGNHVRVEDMRRRCDNALRMLLKLESGLIGDALSIISDLDGLRPMV